MLPTEDWIDRTWSFDLPARRFPSVVERVRGTPARAAELMAGIPDEVLTARLDGSWSAQEHVAHLDDLHELDVRRLGEFTAGAEVLSPADMSNARTNAARHNETSAAQILDRLRHHRESFVAKLEALSEEAVVTSCLHPRLKRQMRLIDWVYFIAEHDDHHLVRARRAVDSRGQGSVTG